MEIIPRVAGEPQNINVVARFEGKDGKHPQDKFKSLRISAALRERLMSTTTGGLNAMMNLLIRYALTVLGERRSCLRIAPVVDLSPRHDGRLTHRDRSRRVEVIPAYIDPVTGVSLILVESFGGDPGRYDDLFYRLRINHDLVTQLQTHVVGTVNGAITALLTFALDDLSDRGLVVQARATRTWDRMKRAQVDQVMDAQE
ncbi:hypothetical protein [Paraburkholderia sp. C35]|uniref:hypothetical protein n=1 Tax=Paraburkholderia sp. C35 TaxID=2126993 RepID=UPI000D68C878|nr:hypothetical protein [Paraburkholderia sp. C35]